jgi:TRAP-type C4-dicarboxylate transport system permease small subunit
VSEEPEARTSDRAANEAPEAAAIDGALTAPPAWGPGRAVRSLEHGLLIAALAAAAALPLVDTLGRPFGVHIPAGADYLKQVVLWLAFLGGLVATRERRHLSLSTAELFAETGRVRRFGRVVAAAVAAATCGILAYASVGLVLANREEGRTLLGGVPVWTLELVMPFALGLMALRFAWAASRRWPGRLVALGKSSTMSASGMVASSSGCAISWIPANSTPICAGRTVTEGRTND